MLEEKLTKKDIICFGLLISILIVSIFSYLYEMDYRDKNTVDYDFRYYCSDSYFFKENNISVYFYSHDKADDYLEFYFFRDGNYTISIFYDIEGDFNRNYFLKENINVTGLGTDVYEFKITKTDLFNPSILIESEHWCEWTEFETHCIGVELN